MWAFWAKLSSPRSTGEPPAACQRGSSVRSTITSPSVTEHLLLPEGLCFLISRLVCSNVCGAVAQPQGRVEGRTPTQVPLRDEETDNLQRRGEALKVNISAGEGLQDVLKSNLGPSGTIKMYVAADGHWGGVMILTDSSRLVDGAGGVRIIIILETIQRRILILPWNRSSSPRTEMFYCERWFVKTPCADDI